MYLEDMNKNHSEVHEQEVKITLVDLLQQYINNKNNVHELVPINMGIEEASLATKVAEYNKLQLERDNNLRTTTPDNPLIRSFDSALEKIRRDMSEALRNVKHSYEIIREKMIQQQNDIGGRLRSMPGKSMQLAGVIRREKILEQEPVAQFRHVHCPLDVVGELRVILE
jgi:myo-inositol-1-phosphate synthase